MLITNKLPNSLSAEAYKTLRTNIEQITSIDNIKTILITSSISGEGKSTVAGNLAISLSKNNYKVLAIDCDLRRPSLHDKFNIENEYGVGEILLGENELKSSIKKIDSRLSVLTAGKIKNDTAELFATENMKQLLDEVRITYDYIIIDSAPIIPVADTSVLARGIDAAVLVVRANKSIEKLVIQGYEKLKKTSIKILGTVSNDSKRKSMNKFYMQYLINSKSRVRKKLLWK